MRIISIKQVISLVIWNSHSYRICTWVTFLRRLLFTSILRLCINCLFIIRGLRSSLIFRVLCNGLWLFTTNNTYCTRCCIYFRLSFRSSRWFNRRSSLHRNVVNHAIIAIAKIKRISLFWIIRRLFRFWLPVLLCFFPSFRMLVKWLRIKYSTLLVKKSAYLGSTLLISWISALLFAKLRLPLASCYPNSIHLIRENGNSKSIFLPLKKYDTWRGTFSFSASTFRDGDECTWLVDFLLFSLPDDLHR